jgi:flagellar hook assembly protein FlgD
MGVRARVEVLDLAGRRVRELTDEVLPPGRHELSWDGRDAGGSPIATGLYWVTLERGGARQQRRIVVVR